MELSALLPPDFRLGLWCCVSVVCVMWRRRKRDVRLRSGSTWWTLSRNATWCCTSWSSSTSQEGFLIRYLYTSSRRRCAARLGRVPPLRGGVLDRARLPRRLPWRAYLRGSRRSTSWHVHGMLMRGAGLPLDVGMNQILSHQKARRSRRISSQRQVHWRS